jgi:predicted dithiol-disulfide oxidoreductase (DUF899 family)
MRDRSGLSAFVLEDGVIYHTYCAYARGVDGLWGIYETGAWLRRHDEYANQRTGAR